MRADKDKLKKADVADIIHELSLIKEELSSVMHPTSWARTKELLEYSKELYTELKARK